MYELKEPFYGITKIYAESFIDLPNIEWRKYTTNGLCPEDDYSYYSAFSHFTYEETGKILVITDL